MKNKIFMISGPNGAGKTTTAMSFISNEIIDEFINADEIARGLAPLHPASMSLTASKLLMKRLHELLEAKRNFAFETTGAGINYIKHLKHAQGIGYEAHLLFYGFLAQIWPLNVLPIVLGKVVIIFLRIRYDDGISLD